MHLLSEELKEECVFRGGGRCRWFLFNVLSEYTEVTMLWALQVEMSGSNGCIDLEARWEKSPLLKIEIWDSPVYFWGGSCGRMCRVRDNQE